MIWPYAEYGIWIYVKGRFQKLAWLSQLYGGSLGKNNQIKESREFISLWRPLLWKPGTNLIPQGQTLWLKLFNKNFICQVWSLLDLWHHICKFKHVASRTWNYSVLNTKAIIPKCFQVLIWVIFCVKT